MQHAAERLWHRCFPVNFAKFLRIPFSQNTSGRLLLNSNHLNSRGLHLNDFNNFLKIWLRLFENYDMKKSCCVWNHAITIPEYLQIVFHAIIIFFQPNVNSLDFFNTSFKKQLESVANQISNKAKNTNHNLDIEGLINSRRLYTNNAFIGYLNISCLRNKITQLREVW